MGVRHLPSLLDLLLSLVVQIHPVENMKKQNYDKTNDGR